MGGCKLGFSCYSCCSLWTGFEEQFWGLVVAAATAADAWWREVLSNQAGCWSNRQTHRQTHLPRQTAGDQWRIDHWHNLAKKKVVVGILPVARMCSACTAAFAICSLLRASAAARRSSALLWAAANLFIMLSFACDHIRSTLTCGTKQENKPTKKH